MTREEFARRWLNAPSAAPPEMPPARKVTRLTDVPTRVFKEKGPRPSRLIRVGGILVHLCAWSVAASVLFISVALLIEEMAPFVTEYVATYFTF